MKGQGFLQMSDLVYALGCMKLSLNDTEVQELVALSGKLLFFTTSSIKISFTRIIRRKNSYSLESKITYNNLIGVIIGSYLRQIITGRISAGRT
jgi:hypothetical protein